MKINRIRILFTNIFIINSKGKNILIDTGYPITKGHFLKKIKYDIDFVILTHTHFDHSGNAIYLKERGSLIVVHENEKDWLLNGSTPPPPGVGTIGKNIMRFSFLKSFDFPPVEPDIVISDYREIAGLLVVHTPGHTPGSISVIYEDVAFCGDLIMNLSWRPSSHLPIFAHNIKKVKESIKKLIDMGVGTFYPAHGRPVSVERLKI